MDKWEELGLQLLDGYKIDEIDFKGKKIKLNEKQKLFVNNLKQKFILMGGGFASGKSLALYIKAILFCKCFPGNRVLLGRRTLMDIERAILPDLLDLMPNSWYKHRVKDAVINFNNGSQIILFGLDALQTGSLGDIKKAQQKIKSLNLGAFFIDQLEEVDYPVFEMLSSRLRRMYSPQAEELAKKNKFMLRQGDMTCNPANFWAYQYFVKGEDFFNGEWRVPAKPSKFRKYYKTSMLDNVDNLPKDMIEEQLSHDDRYVRRYIYGEWTTDALTHRAVIAPEYVRRLELMRKPSIAVEEGCKIWEQPKNMIYQMGVDPSEGVVDPCSITVVSSEGRKVASFDGKIPIHALSEKVKFLYYKYKKPLIIPEANAMGAALIEGIKDLKVYKRKVFEYKENREMEKLGFKTSHQSKGALISHFIDMLRAGWPKIHDNDTIEQFKTFVWTDDVRQQGAGAQRGFHDDMVMSTLLAFWNITQDKMDRRRIQRSQSYPKKQFQYE